MVRFTTVRLSTADRKDVFEQSSRNLGWEMGSTYPVDQYLQIEMDGNCDRSLKTPKEILEVELR